MRAACVLVALLLSIGARGAEEDGRLSLRRDDFPSSFVFGSGTSAYQVEGAASEDGRTPSIWDTSAHGGKETGDIATDEYHKFKEDIKLMKEMGLEGFRFSISWSRLIPNGRGVVNPKGLQYYNNLINELLSYGIEPHATLFHYDLPQVLEDEYGGWLNQQVVDDFTAYADVCFKEFGDRVSHWTTINEPNAFVQGGYIAGIFPPNRCSYPFGVNCTRGDSVHEPYVAAHHCLLAHSSAVTLYRKKYQAKQKGLIGINVLMNHMLPITHLTEDIVAAKRAQEFFSGWFIDPVLYGDYPSTMRRSAGKKIPEFSEAQSKQLIGSIDFIGVNYYFAFYVKDDPCHLEPFQRDFFGDICAKVTGKKGGSIDDQIAAMANGLQGVLEYLKQVYGNPPIYIHENGYAMPQKGTLNDTPRVQHLTANLGSLLNSLRNGSNTKGYFTWSFLDAFELFGGYEIGYGLYYVDFEDKNLRRYPKLSALWYSDFLKSKEPPAISAL